MQNKTEKISDVLHFDMFVHSPMTDYSLLWSSKFLKEDIKKITY